VGIEEAARDAAEHHPRSNRLIAPISRRKIMMVKAQVIRRAVDIA